jgi:WD40 repeat protein/predicted Ser/Thr protein kinase
MASPPTCSRCGSVLASNLSSAVCPTCSQETPTIQCESSAVATDSESQSIIDSLASSSTTILRSKILRRLDDYELVEELGRGGMGVVFKALQKSLNREVALKMILAGQFASEADVKRFRIEAEAAAGLDHPNIVSVYDIGDYEGHHYFSMKLVEGESLSRKIQQFNQDPVASAKLLIKIARAVHYAHQRGILHRDLKPANILLDSRGEPHISDFGLARRIQGDMNLTLSGAVVGTPSYMAPEQASGQTKGLTTAADVYSLGAIFYHLLVGRPPFYGESMVEILRQVLEDDPPKPSTLRPSVNRDLETICLKCLDKEPGRRYGSAEALADDIERWQRLEPIQARPTTPSERVAKWIQRKPIIAALSGGLLLVAVAGISGIVSQWKRAEQKATESQQRLVRLNVVNGVRFAKEGDLAGALLWYTEALRLNEGLSASDEIRIRIGSLLQEIPQLRRVWFHERPVWLAQLSPTEDLLATISGPDALKNRFKQAELRVWDRLSGKPVSPPIPFAGGRPPMYRIRYQVFSPDAEKIVSIQSRDADDKKILSEVTLYDARSGKAILPALQHEGTVSDVAFSPDGSYLMSASTAGTAKVWDLSKGGAQVSLLAHEAWITVGRFSPNNRHLVTGSMDKTAKVWDFRSGQLAAPILPHARFVLDAQFNHEGTRIVTVASDGTGGEFRVWDAADGRQICSMDNPLARVESVLYQASFSPDGHKILTASFDGNASLWDGDTGRMLSAPLKHNNGVLMAVFSPDASSAITASYDNTARLWRTDGGSSASAILNHCSFVLGALFSKTGQQVITASTDGMVRAWELPGSPAGMITLSHSNSVLHAEFSRNGSRILTASVDHTARVWDARTGSPVTPPLVHDGPVNHAAFSPDGSLVVTASADGTARLWAAANGRQVGPPLRHSNTVWYAEFNAAGSQIVTASGQFRNLAAASSRALRDFSAPQNPHRDLDGEARVWDVRTGQAVTPPLLHNDAVVHASFSPDNKSLVTASADRTAQIWKLPEGIKIGSALTNAGIVFHAVYNPKGDQIATVSGGDGSLEKNAARLWNAYTGESIGQGFEHSDIVYSGVFSQDGQRLVTGSEDGTARIWDVRTGESLGAPLVNGSIVLRADFSPDGRFVLTVALDGTARVWDARTGEMIAQLRIHKQRINTGSFSPDGRQILTASDDGTVRVCSLPRSDWRIEDLALLSQVLSARQIDKRGTEMGRLNEREFRKAWLSLCDRFPRLFSASGYGK